MARIYKKAINPSSEYTAHVYQAIGDEPLKDDKGQFAGYPTANMSVAVYPSKAEPNFDLNKQPTPVDENDNRGILKNIRNANAAIKKETGVDADTVSSDYLQNAVNSAITHHIDSTTARTMNWYTPDERKGIIRKSGIAYAKDIRNIRKASSEMFTTTPQRAEVYAAFSHTKMRHTVPIMGAIAHQEHGTLTAGGSLSSHSSKIVKNAQEKGLPIQSSVHNPSAEATNAHVFDDKSQLSFDGKPDQPRSTEYTPQQLRSAKMHYRQLRGHSSAKSTSPQFEQLQLPGMEQ